jgi:hypothetical protein
MIARVMHVFASTTAQQMLAMGITVGTSETTGSAWGAGLEAAS